MELVQWIILWPQEGSQIVPPESVLRITEDDQDRITEETGEDRITEGT